MPDYRTLFESAVDDALHGVTVLTGNERAARQIHNAVARRMHAAGTAVWPTPNVLTFDAFARALWSQAVVAGAVSTTLLSPTQEQVLWENVFSRTRDGAGLANPRGASALAAEAWTRLHEFRVPLNASAFDATAETRSFARWAAQYRDECSRKLWIDTARLPDALTTAISELRPLLPATITVYGFDQMVPQKRAFLDALGEQGIPVRILSAEAVQVSEAIKLCFDDPLSEVQAIARWARNVLRSESTATIGVIIPNLQQLRSVVEHVFTSVLHPEQFILGDQQSAVAFDLSLGPPLGEYLLVHTALLVTGLLSGEITISNASKLLRSPYLGGAPEEAGSRAVLDVTIKRKATGSILCVSDLREFARRYHCPVLARHLSQFLATVPSLDVRQSPAEWVESFSNSLAALGWPAGPLSSAEYQAHEAWNDLLREYAALDGFIGAQTAREFSARLSAMANSQPFRPENAGAAIQVIGVLESAGSVFDHLWVAGLHDEAWPPRGRPNPFLPIALQRRYGLPNSSPGQIRAFAGQAFTRLLSSARSTVLSWPKREDDRQLRSSPAIAGIATSNADEIVGPPSHDWVTEMRGAPHETFSDEQGPPIDATERIRHSTRLIELQSNCPFLAFAEGRLHAKESDEPRDGLSPIERGKVVEHALEAVWSRIRDLFTLQTTPENQIEQIVSEAVDAALATLPPASDDWSVRYRSLERERTIQLVLEWLESEKKRRLPFEVIAHQKEAEISLGGYSVKGRIDRLDRLGDGSVVIIDYKSGKTIHSPRHWSGERPEKPQLPIYAVAQTQPVSGVAFAQIYPGRCCYRGYGVSTEVFGQDRDTTRNYFTAATFQEHVANWRPILDALGHSFVSGEATVDPYPDHVCDQCHVTALCRLNAHSSCPDPGDDNDE